MSTTPFTATVLGLPRIGPNRELKKAVEAYWAGRSDRASLEATAAQLRRDQLTQLQAAGLDSIPVGSFSYYDHVLDTTVLLGALPKRYDVVADEVDRYFAAARGNAELTPLEMTKWFNTNYHYLVPEIPAETTFSLNPAKLLAELAEARELGVPARPVVVGPITYLLLAKSTDGDPLARLDEVVACYEELLPQLAAAGAEWVQIDEPALVTDLTDGQLAAVGSVYDRLSAVAGRPAILVATYFGRPGAALGALAGTAIEAVALDITAPGTLDELAAEPRLSGKHVVAGVVNGRNIWRADLDKALGQLQTVGSHAASVAVSTSSSILHVPYSLAPETDLDNALRSWLAFGAEKVGEVVALARVLAGGEPGAEFAEARTAAERRAGDPRVVNSGVRARLAALTGADATRSPAHERRVLQAEVLNLPLLPTTTIGSYPQTSEIRVARAQLRSGAIDEAEYTARMRAEVADVIALQEAIGLDVLVHGEPERNDMVQYFAEQLDGFAATINGWVQSYGSRCVRPPVLFGDVSRPEPMTVDWFAYAQSLSEKPVKGMLTGPVTILAWSFVRDDQPLADTARQIALAIRDETVDLEQAGARVIQVDEPALRELLPLRNADKAAYLRWAVDAFRLSTAGVRDATQVHTHLCYSEFGEVIGAIAELDADVTSIEAARSRMEVLDDLNAVGYDLGIGPGVYDIHSPRVPSVDEVVESLRAALDAVAIERVWVNPDCGLKTRGPVEVEASLRNLVTAAAQVRAAVTVAN